MGKKKKEQSLLIADKKLKRVLNDYCDCYYGKISDLPAIFEQMGIAVPTTLEKFDGKRKFRTTTGEKITLSSDIEDGIAIMIVKKGNVEKLYQCFIPEKKVELQCIQVESDKQKTAVYFGSCYSELETLDAKMRISQEKVPILKEYLNNLTQNLSAVSFLEKVCELI